MTPLYVGNGVRMAGYLSGSTPPGPYVIICKFVLVMLDQGALWVGHLCVLSLLPEEVGSPLVYDCCWLFHVGVFVLSLACVSIRLIY